MQTLQEHFCKHCNTIFLAYRSQNKKFCSIICRDKNRKETCGTWKQCQKCDQKFKQRKSTQRFCSKKCFSNSQYIEIKCIFCEKQFIALSTKNRKFCSKSCFQTNRRGKPHMSEVGKEKNSKSRQIDWSRGVYSNASVGKTKWHDHTKPCGEKIRLQGTWELKYAMWLDEHDIAYTAHKGSLWYEHPISKKQKIYMPDFWLVDEQTYVDVKNDYLLKVDSEKINAVRKSNPNIKLKIVSKTDLINLGIQI